ncbi:MAG: YceI family protein [Acidimicrobiales bacterium]
MAATTASELNIATGKWTIDPSHSNVEFVVRHMMVSKVRGRFNAFSGEVEIADNIADSTVTASIEVNSVDTRDENRDGHLRSADFFDVETYPTMTFKSTKIEPKGSDYTLTGDLTIKGTTNSVSFDLEFNGAGPDAYGGTRAGFSATTKISRKEFGLTWNALLETGGAVVSDEATIHLEIELVKA